MQAPYSANLASIHCKLRSNFDEGCVGVAPREEDGGRKEGRKVPGRIIGGGKSTKYSGRAG